jgi:prophage maintenance system killer protein
MENIKQEPKGEIVIYHKAGKAGLEVKLQDETVWLNLNQMAELFGRDKSVISRHVRNVYNEKELSEKSTVAFFATVQKEGSREIERQIEYYSLDMILSVGYRVNSKMGTRFRIWATTVLKDHLIKGFTVNQKRLVEHSAKFNDLQNAVSLLSRVVESRQLASPEAVGLLKVITDYTRALTILDDYDHHKVEVKHTSGKGKFVITYDKARNAIDTLGQQAQMSGQKVGLFGIERGGAFKSALGNIYQTFDANELYPSIEEKAAHLLYFLIKDHPFTDGNKRIGAFLFIWFMDANRILYASDGRKRIGDNTLVALALMIAESRPSEKDVIIKVIVNLINKENV